MPRIADTNSAGRADDPAEAEHAGPDPAREYPQSQAHAGDSSIARGHRTPRWPLVVWLGVAFGIVALQWRTEPLLGPGNWYMGEQAPSLAEHAWWFGSPGLILTAAIAATVILRRSRLPDRAIWWTIRWGVLGSNLALLASAYLGVRRYFLEYFALFQI